MRIKYYLIFFISLMFAIGCGKENQTSDGGKSGKDGQTNGANTQNGNGGGGQTGEGIEGQPIEMVFLMGADSYEVLLPRLVACTDGWGYIEYANSGKNDVMTVELLSPKGKDDALFLLRDNQVLMTFASPETGELCDTLFYYQSLPSEKKVSLCAVSWESGVFAVIEEHSISSTASMQASTLLDPKKSKSDGMDDIRRVFYNMLEEMKSDCSRLGNTTGFISTFGSVSSRFTTFLTSEVPNIISLFIIPSIEERLYEDDNEMVAEIKKGWYTDLGKAVLTLLMPTKALKRVSYGALLLLDGKTSLWDKIGPKVSDDAIPAELPNPSKYNGHLDIIKDFSDKATPIEEMKPQYEVLLNAPKGITETSVTLSGSVQSANGVTAFISKTGFVLVSEEEEIIAVEADKLQETTISNLKMATTYHAYAFVDSMGERYLSEERVFSTKVQLDVTQTELSFPCEGGTRGVAVTVGEGATWDIEYLPTWLTVEKGEGTFFVTAKPSYWRAQESFIKVTARYPSGRSRTEYITTTQEAGYSYPFSGKVLKKGTTKYYWKSGGISTYERSNNVDIRITYRSNQVIDFAFEGFCCSLLFSKEGIEFKDESNKESASISNYAYTSNSISFSLEYETSHESTNNMGTICRERTHNSLVLNMTDILNTTANVEFSIKIQTTETYENSASFKRIEYDYTANGTLSTERVEYN